MLSVALACAAPACDKGESEKKAEDRSQELVETRAKLTQRLAPVVSAYAATPDPKSVQEASCDEKALSDEEGNPGALVVGEHTFLARLQKPELDPYAGAGAPFKALTTPALRILVPAGRVQTPQQGIDALWNAQKLERDYTHLGVLRADQRVGPRLDGDKFHGGEYSGVLIIFRLGTPPQQLCQARIEAKSSENVAGAQGDAREAALWNDFLSNLKNEVHAAAKRIAPGLRVDLD